MLNPSVHLLSEDSSCIAYVRLTQYVDRYFVFSHSLLGNCLPLDGVHYYESIIYHNRFWSDWIKIE